MSNGQFLKEMGAKVKKARKAKGMTLQQMSSLTGIDLSNLWFVESGKRNPHILTLKGIADVLKVDIKDFI